MAKKATPEELEAAKLLDAALEAEANALPTVQQDTPSIGPAADAAGNEPGELAPVVSETPKKKRGRPTDAERALKESLGVPGNDSSAVSGGAKRGPKPKGAAKGNDPTTLGKSLVGIHQLVAMVTGIPEAQLSEPEGQALAEAVCAVCEEYGFAVDGKTGAAMQLFGACAMIYGPRLFHFKARIAQQRAQGEQVNGGSNAPGN